MKKKYSDITGVILSGGSSSRMGTDKALLKIGGQTIIEKTCELMSNVFENLLLSTNDFDSYRFLELTMIDDFYKGHGPLSGIHSALGSSTTDRNFILSCDLPFMSEEMIRHIIEINSSKLISIPIANERNQPLCGVYHKSLISIIEEMILDSDKKNKENGKSNASMKKLLEKVSSEFIETKSLPFYNEDLFFNMNSTDDYDFIKKRISE